MRTTHSSDLLSQWKFSGTNKYLCCIQVRKSLKLLVWGWKIKERGKEKMIEHNFSNIMTNYNVCSSIYHGIYYEIIFKHDQPIVDERFTTLMQLFNIYLPINKFFYVRFRLLFFCEPTHASWCGMTQFVVWHLHTFMHKRKILNELCW